MEQKALLHTVLTLNTIKTNQMLLFLIATYKGKIKVTKYGAANKKLNSEFIYQPL
jgi:hypothetical protein